MWKGLIYERKSFTFFTAVDERQDVGADWSRWTGN